MTHSPEREHTPCNLCGTDYSRHLMTKHDCPIVQCRECGLVYVNPRIPTKDLAEKVYGAEYFNAERGYGLEDHFSDENRDHALRWGRARLQWIEQHMSPGSLLDVGCAAGFFLLAAKKRAWDPHGIEISHHASEYARSVLGLDVATQEFSGMDPEPGQYELVTMLDVIEHLPDPLRGLRNAYTVLKPGGFVFLATPNFHSIPARALGENWGLIEPDHHLYYFTPETMDAMLQKSGFRVVAHRWPLLGLNDLFLSAGALQKAGVPVTAERKKILRQILRGPRSAARKLLGAADASVFAPLFAKGRGSIIEVLARKA